MFTVYNVGMIYFDGCNLKDKRALIPDGREGDLDHGTPRHYASLFVAADRVDLDNTRWWWGSKFEREVTFFDEQGKASTVQVYEFRIKNPSDINFPDKRNGKPAEFKDLEELPRLQSDTDFKLATDPKTIARVALRSGILEARALSDVPVVRWTVEEHADPIRITARDDDGNDYCVALKDAATLERLGVVELDSSGRYTIEMVLSNTPDFIALMEGPIGNGHDAQKPDHGGNDPDHPAHNDGGRHGADPVEGDNGKHFEHGSIYGKLNESGNPVKLDGNLRPELKPIRLKRGYLQFLGASSQYRESDCTPTCCKTNGP